MVSSILLPATINWGIPFLVTYPSSISLFIIGTTTAGRNDINIAGLPTFFKSDIFKDKPALVNIIIKAIFLI